MRIISGKHRGRKLIESKQFKALRPTTDANRENLFNILALAPEVLQTGFKIEDCDFLDAFCGSGAVALEAISRGAKTAGLIDNNREHLNLAKANAELLKESNLEYFCADLSKPLFKNNRQYNLIFIDPPYHKNLAAISAINLLKSGWIKDNAIIIIEHSFDENLDSLAQEFKLIKHKKYKETMFSFLKIKPAKGQI